MGIRYFNIQYDRDTFLPGQMVSGKVRLSIDQPQEIRSIELTLSGEAECHWTRWESFQDSKGKTKDRTVLCGGKETYFNIFLTLAGGEQTFILPTGDYEYPFSASLPTPLPSTYVGTYGGISYYGEAKLNLPWAPDRFEKKQHFLVKNPIDLNKMMELNQPYRNEQSKMFWCWFHESGPLTVNVYIPRTGFVSTEAIPITIYVQNGSEVKVDSIRIELNQVIKWQTSTVSEQETDTVIGGVSEHTSHSMSEDSGQDTNMAMFRELTGVSEHSSHKVSKDCREETNTIIVRKLAGVSEHRSHSVNYTLELGPRQYPKSANCGIIRIRYELEIVMEVNWMHSNLEMKVPITIGDIPFRGSLPDRSPYGEIGLVSAEPDVPPRGATASYPKGNTTPYPEAAASAQYPDAREQPYPGAPAAPYSGAAWSLYPAAGGVPDSHGTSQSYPGVSYSGAAYTPDSSDPNSQPTFVPPPAQTPYLEGSKFM